MEEADGNGIIGLNLLPPLQLGGRHETGKNGKNNSWSSASKEEQQCFLLRRANPFQATGGVNRTPHRAHLSPKRPKSEELLLLAGATSLNAEDATLYRSVTMRANNLSLDRNVLDATCGSDQLDQSCFSAKHCLDFWCCSVTQTMLETWGTRKSSSGNSCVGKGRGHISNMGARCKAPWH